MKEYKIIYNVKECDLNQLSKDGWTIVNIFPSEFEEYKFHYYKSIELTAVLYRDKTENEILENNMKSWLENQFDVKISDEDVDKFNTVEDIINYLQKYNKND